MSHRVLHYKRQSGERFCKLLNNETGLPLFYPNIYAISQVRNRGLSFSSLEAAVSSIQVAYDWFDDRDINLEERILKKSFLTISEMDALKDRCQRKKTPPESKCLSPLIKTHNAKAHLVSSALEHSRLSHIANYIEWLSDVLLGNGINTDIRASINKCCSGIRERRPPISNQGMFLEDAGLTSELIEEILKIIHPESPSNPFINSGVRTRNHLIFKILEETGMRCGELLNLRIPDIHLRSIPPDLHIIRRADEKDDPRTHQPLVKTRERALPLTSNLADLINNYLLHHRRTVPNAKKHDYLLVAHKSGKGQTQGAPLSISGYQFIVQSVRRATLPLLPTGVRISGHKFRHAWNNRYSEWQDARPEPLSHDMQKQARCEAMGWTANSTMAERYDRRFIQQKANEAMLLMAEKLNKSRGDSDSE